jgi:hypothetical protein
MHDDGIRRFVNVDTHVHPVHSGGSILCRTAWSGAAMKVAIFTDSDFDTVSGVTTSLRAALRYAPPGIRPRVLYGV